MRIVFNTGKTLAVADSGSGLAATVISVLFTLFVAIDIAMAVPVVKAYFLSSPPTHLDQYLATATSALWTVP